MPPLPGQELGEAPPPAPRPLPSGFARRTRLTGNIATLLGGGFSLISAVFFFAAVAVQSWIALAPLLFLVGGLLLLRHGWKHGSQVLRAFRHGIATPGEVFECNVDRTQHINGQHPFKLIWHFTAGGKAYEGTLTSFDSTLASRAQGQPVWVLFVENDPEQNTIYPPIR